MAGMTRALNFLPAVISFIARLPYITNNFCLSRGPSARFVPLHVSRTFRTDEHGTEDMLEARYVYSDLHVSNVITNPSYIDIPTHGVGDVLLGRLLASFKMICPVPSVGPIV